MLILYHLCMQVGAILDQNIATVVKVSGTVSSSKSKFMTNSRTKLSRKKGEIQLRLLRLSGQALFFSTQ